MSAPTTLQLATLFNIAGSLLVLGLAVLTHRLRPSPFFRAWIVSTGWAVVLTIVVATESIWPPTTATAAVAYVPLCLFVWYAWRVGYELLERPFPGFRLGVLLVAHAALGIALGLAGGGYKAAMIPGPIAVVVTYVWLGRTMFRVGRTPAYEGMGWIGAPVMLHGLWLLSYPVFEGTAWLWLGYGVAALMAVGVGIGMVMFVLLRTTRQLEARNHDLLAAELALRAAQEERDRLQREFLSAASHELRTPLTTVIGYADFLAEAVSGSLNPDQERQVAQIRKGASRMRRLVDDMLDFSSLEAGAFALDPQPIDVGAVVRGEVLAFQAMAEERGVALALELPPGPLPAVADPGRIGQVVANLVGNALKFTEPGGRVAVRAAAEDGAVRIEVRDDGVGIGPEHLPHVFEKYYRVDRGAARRLGGAGLGLAICRALVEAQGGRIGVESTPGRGSVFWFTVRVRP